MAKTLFEENGRFFEPVTREELEERERRCLAPYAMRSADTRGRAHDEPEHPYRTAFQRDHDRIIHSKAFRRLEYKTQVFVNHEGDNFRTRLTHTVEVAQIARVIARALRLNEDLVETIALAHDLGHGPFGHSGEDALNQLMKKEGGFEHNVHGLRVVDRLEERYPNFPGLNLTYEVRESIVKHSTRYDNPRYVGTFDADRRPLLEAQVVDIADSIAYDSHDLDDGLAMNILDEKDIENCALIGTAYHRAQSAFPTAGRSAIRSQTVRFLIDTIVSDLIANTLENLKSNRISSVDEVKKHPGGLVTFSPELGAKKRAVEQFLMERVYRHYRVMRMHRKAIRIVTDLWNAYTEDRQILPTRIQRRIAEGEKIPQVVCDYIAGMTDRFAAEEHLKLFSPDVRV